MASVSCATKSCFFKNRNFPVLNFRHFCQIAVALRALDFATRLLDLLLDLARALHRGFFRLPDLVEIGKLAVEFGDIRFQIGQTLFRLLVLLLLQRLALDLELDQAALEPIELLGLGIDFHADARSRFVHQIDGLVRQLAIRDVAMRQRRCGDNAPDR